MRRSISVYLSICLSVCLSQSMFIILYLPTILSIFRHCLSVLVCQLDYLSISDKLHGDTCIFSRRNCSFSHMLCNYWSLCRSVGRAVGRSIGQSEISLLFYHFFQIFEHSEQSPLRKKRKKDTQSN